MEVELAFEEFWRVKPKRKGSNPKEQARLKFLRAVTNGAEAEKIVGAARAWAKQERENGKDDTEYVAMAVTWLNQKRYNDYASVPPADESKWDAIADKHGYFWNGERYVRRETAA